jgi:hypothetical protein
MTNRKYPAVTIAMHGRIYRNVLARITDIPEGFRDFTPHTVLSVTKMGHGLPFLISTTLANLILLLAAMNNRCTTSVYWNIHLWYTKPNYTKIIMHPMKEQGGGGKTELVQ